jgi:hypothetical protein
MPQNYEKIQFLWKHLYLSIFEQNLSLLGVLTQKSIVFVINIKF